MVRSPNTRGLRIAAPAATLFILLAAVAGPVAAHHPGGSWGTAVSAESPPGTSSELNTSFNDGCPIEGPDGRTLYTATTRPGAVGGGGIDIWVATRPNTSAPFGAPVPLPAPINSPADDFCPTPIIGGGLFFVSSRAVPGACGVPPTGDIYFAWNRPGAGWTEPRNLGCQVDGGPNSALGEAGPSYFFARGHGMLYFSSGPDIYQSVQQWNGSFGPATPVAELNDPVAGDFRPNVRLDGLEVVFDSNRAGPLALGGQDIYVATRARTSDPWSAPVNLGSNINTAAAETRASFSLFANRLYFGRTPGPDGGTDIFVSTR
jgi:hypothetical protein